MPAGLLRLPEVPPRVGVPWGHHPAGCGVLVATGWHCGAVPERGGDGWLCPAATSPTLHPVQSPQNRFCILTVAPDTLPAIATMLIDVLFYSHRWVTRVGTSSAAVPQLGVTPLHLAPCGFPSSGCVFAKCCCSLEHAARGRCVSCCHSWELEPPSPGVTVLGDKPRIAAKQRGAGERWLRCAGAVHGNILGTALWDRPLRSHHGALGMPPNPLFLRPTDWWDTNPYRAPPAAPPRSPVLVARTSTPSPSSPSRSSRATSPS